MPKSLVRVRPAAPLSRAEQERLLKVPADTGLHRAAGLAVLIALGLTWVLARIGWPPSENVDYAAWAYWVLFLGPGVTAGALAGGFSVWVDRNVMADAPQLRSLVDIERRRLNWAAEQRALPHADSDRPAQDAAHVQVQSIEFVAERAWLLTRVDAGPGALLFDGAQCLVVGTLPDAIFSAGHHRRSRWKLQRFSRTQTLWTALTRGRPLEFTALAAELSAGIHPGRVELLAPEQLPAALADATMGIREGYR